MPLTGCRVFAILFFAFIPSIAAATTIAGAVSSRNAADTVTGAHQFLKSHPSQLLKLKTTDQFVEMSQQKQWLESADLVFAGGVFGVAGENLISSLKQHWIKNFIAVHSDRNLVKLSQLGGRSVLDGADLDQLMVAPSSTLTPIHGLLSCLKNIVSTDSG